MEKILSMHLNKFCKSKKWKNKDLKYVFEKYISIVPRLLFFKITDLYIVYLFWQIKHRQLRIRS